MPFYSPSTGGFYHRSLHGDAMPADAVKITPRKHALLLEAQAAGASIVAGPNGPIAEMPLQSHADQVEAAKRRVRKEAKRRILRVAPLELQSNDNAAIACAALQAATDIGMTIDVGPALARRRTIDAIRAASNAIELELEALPTDELVTFRASQSPTWPKIEEAA